MSDSVSAPCPWCEDGGRPHLRYNRETFFSFTVQCEDCKAHGPRIKFDITEYQMGRKSWKDFIAPIEQQAIDAWNEWMKHYQSVVS